MKKLNLNLENIKVMLSKQEMARISGGDSDCRDNPQCSSTKCEEKVGSSSTYKCSDCCIA